MWGNNENGIREDFTKGGKKWLVHFDKNVINSN